jgi:pyridoxamine 5'-phosphate oxidase
MKMISRKENVPTNQLGQWLNEENIAGVANPSQAVLSTCTKTAVPHSRVVAIRDITEEGLVFFTQRGTRKVEELALNPSVSLTFWFEVTQRQVIIEGVASPLSESKNQAYWSTYSKFAQVRFCAYAPTSGQIINSKKTLEKKRKLIEQEYEGLDIPISSFYCGYLIKPSSYTFYAYRADELSDVSKYLKNKDSIWEHALISP